MSARRGSVVVLDFPQGPGQPSKRRPVLVVQSDHNNGRLNNAIFAMITSSTRLAGKEATQVLVDPATLDGQSSGLAHRSAVKCENLYTFPQKAIHRTIGTLSAPLMQQVDDALKASLALS